MRRPRRSHTAAFKAKVAVAALKGDKTLTELAEKFDLHTNQITQWRSQLLEGATDVFLTPVGRRQLSWPVDDNYLGRLDRKPGRSGSEGYSVLLTTIVRRH